jgi:ABC-type nitrate/sulfonate/bicarbonate transport system permease component
MPDSNQRNYGGKPPPLTVWQRIKRSLRSALDFIAVEAFRAAIATIIAVAITYSLAAGIASSPAEQPDESQATTE